MSRRILYKSDQTGDEFRELAREVEEIRDELSRLRRRLADVALRETYFPHDSIAGKVEGALTLDIMALYTLVHGERSLYTRADIVDEVWRDAAEHPDHYAIREENPDGLRRPKAPGQPWIRARRSR